MKHWLSLLRGGKGLRHAPVVYGDAPQLSLRVMLQGLPGGPIDVSHDHCPVSLRPLVLGVRLDAEDADAARRLWLEICPPGPEAAPLARVALKPTGALPMKRGALHLFEAEGTVNRCLPRPALWLRYLLAWQNARTSARRGDALCMSARDLRALNAYYIVARPVFLVGVGHEERVNLFPMDLVGSLSSGEYLLALRATSPGVALMEASRRIAMSSAPAELLEAVYALGSQHRQPTLDLGRLAVPISRSPLFGLPVLDRPGLVRELRVERVERIGSHVLFITRIERESGDASRQLAHMSGMYIEWLRRRQHACEVLAPL
jgi:flavin reductase (DIM6/NTAB) family NADH-FMN oxidoreductase RutF